MILNIFELYLPVFSFVSLILFILNKVPYIDTTTAIKVIGLFSKNEAASLVATASSIFVAVVLTSLSVLGSSPTKSVVILSKNKKAIKKFIAYASICLGSSVLSLVLSLINDKIPKIFITSFGLSLCSLFSYTVVIIYMFYTNISYAEEVAKTEEKILKEMKLVKQRNNRIVELLEKIINTKPQ